MNISIYLGSRCNKYCKYCHRQYSDLEPVHVGDKLKKLLLEYKDDDLCIGFYGGEPTLYMDFIQKIVDIVPNAQFIITTNGTTLDKYTDYFNAHNFKVVISYDGEGSVREYDPLQKPIHCKNISIASTLYHNHCSLHQLFDDINKKEQLCEHTLNSPPHIVHATRRDNVSFGLTSFEVLDLIVEEREIIHSALFDFRTYGILSKPGLALIDKWFKYIKHNYNKDETYCCNKDSIKVDVFGDEWDCLYMRVRNGKHPKQRTRCEKCDIHKYCGGACAYSVRHGLECLYYRTMINWFLLEYEEYKEEVDEIIRISKRNEFEHSCWC